MIYKRHSIKIKALLVAVLIILAASLTLLGCSKTEKDTQVVFTTDFEQDEVFRIDTISCRVPEVNVYMRTTQDQYESVFGEEIWNKQIGDTTLQNQLKDTILSRLAQIKVMNLLAAQRGLELSEQEKADTENMAKEFMESLSKNEIKELGINNDSVASMYGEYYLANKVYEDVTKEVNPEISDDEARIIKVKHILIKNYENDWNGNRRELSVSANEAARRKADTIYAKIQAGEDFDSLAEKYNEDDETSYAFGKGTMPEAFETAAFNLDKDEISKVVETEYGYHIIKCISTFDKDETDANKVKIVQQRKNDAFNQVYGDFVATVYSNFNDKLWESLNYDNSAQISTTNFFDIYNQYSQAEE